MKVTMPSIRQSTLATVEPILNLNWSKEYLYDIVDRTSVAFTGPPFVIIKTKSKTLKVFIKPSVSTDKIDALISGIVIYMMF